MEVGAVVIRVKRDVKGQLLEGFIESCASDRNVFDFERVVAQADVMDLFAVLPVRVSHVVLCFFELEIVVRDAVGCMWCVQAGQQECCCNNGGNYCNDNEECVERR